MRIWLTGLCLALALAELARRLDAWRLVRSLESHKDALRRQMGSPHPS